MNDILNDKQDGTTMRADSLFLIIVGKKDIMDNLLKELKGYATEQYVISELFYPSANMSLDLMKALNKVDDISLLDSSTQKPVIVDDGVEFAQGHICADDDYAEDNYMLQIVSDCGDYYLLSYPKFDIDEDDSPYDKIEEWFRTNTKKNPDKLRKNTKLLTLTGKNANILAMATILKTPINTNKHQ